MLIIFDQLGYILYLFSMVVGLSHSYHIFYIKLIFQYLFEDLLIFINQIMKWKIFCRICRFFMNVLSGFFMNVGLCLLYEVNLNFLACLLPCIRIHQMHLRSLKGLRLFFEGLLKGRKELGRQYQHILPYQVIVEDFFSKQ